MRYLRLTVSILLLVGTVFAQEWQFEIVDANGSVGMFSSLVLDDIGYPHISYVDFLENTLKYTRWDGTAWQTEIADTSGHVLFLTSQKLDSSGFPHIAYYYASNNTKDLKYAHWDGATWLIETVDEFGDVGSYCSLALDSSDYPHIAYHAFSGLNLKYARWDGTDWQIEIVDAEGYTGLFPSLSLDSSDYPHIAYRNSTDYDLKYARWDGTDWQIEIVDAEGYTGNFPSMDLDSADYPHIAYSLCLPHSGYSRADDLKYASWDGTNWQIETVDSVGYTGSWATLALDSSDYPHIAYCLYEPFYLPDDLKYARWDGASWQIETVDSEGMAGYSISLALDSSDNPYISYSNQMYWDLRFSWWNMPPPVFNLLSPSDGETVTDWPLCDWDDAPDYPSVSYDLWYSTDDTFGTHDEITDLTNSEYQFSNTELESNTTYYWKVRSTDGYEETWSTQTDWWFHVSDLGVSDSFTDIPDFVLHTAYPNPSSNGFNLSYSLSDNGPVKLTIFDLSGRQVATLVDSEVTAGQHNLFWNSTDIDNGIYFYHLKTSAGVLTRQLVVLR